SAFGPLPKGSRAVGRTAIDSTSVSLCVAITSTRSLLAQATYKNFPSGLSARPLEWRPVAIDRTVLPCFRSTTETDPAAEAPVLGSILVGVPDDFACASSFLGGSPPQFET